MVCNIWKSPLGKIFETPVCNLGFQAQIEWLIFSMQVWKKPCEFEEKYEKVTTYSKIAYKISDLYHVMWKSIFG